jgi:hypothetical protein
VERGASFVYAPNGAWAVNDLTFARLGHRVRLTVLRPQE